MTTLSSARPRAPSHPMPSPPTSASKPAHPAHHASRTKPILTWLQRKLASASSRRPHHSAAPTTAAPSTNPRGERYRPLGSPPPTTLPLQLQMHDLLPSSTATTHSPTPSASASHTTRSRSSRSQPTSTWAPTEPAQADDDASTRPLPPTSPPSPAPSRGTSVSTRTGGGTVGSVGSGSGSGYGGGWGYGHAHHPSQALSVSTKPTTLLSIDAVLPPPPARGATAPSIHFTPLPPSSPPPSSPPTPTPSTSTSTPAPALPPHLTRSRVPPHTHPNPSHNPDPFSPPTDNASIWTLASSTAGEGRRGRYDASMYTLEGDAWEDGWEGASVRAIKPGSRRGSWGTGTGTGGLDLDLDGEGEEGEGEERILGEEEAMTDEPGPITPTSLTGAAGVEQAGLSTPVPAARDVDADVDGEEEHVDGEEAATANAAGGMNGHHVENGHAGAGEHGDAGAGEKPAPPLPEEEKADAL